MQYLAQWAFAWSPYFIKGRCRRDFAPRARSLVIWPSPGRDPKGSRLPFGISPSPLTFRDFAPPSSVFEVLISYTLLGSKTTAKRSAISIHAPIIRDVVNETQLDGACAVRLGVIFIFCEFPLIANKNF